ncbi:hypothetical protein LOD99_7648 [Oopsacas minuta]|uniref:Uncharacterized protein n=1 Tax=Oopsacas minuta TaxID=111878 RepID=A0AAV7JP05_9METZ|nr:hypothetical protein LOD99_7648 [Oopsacas minuta]
MSSITELLTQEVNQKCADCSSPNITHVSTKFGTLVCSDCAKIHKDVISDKVELLPCDKLPEDVEINGNVANNTFEQHLPQFYAKPNPESKSWVKEHFINSKYNREIFSSTETLNKSNIGKGVKSGQMHKKGKSKEVWKPRTFILKDGTFKYFINHSDEHPKSIMEVKDIEVKFELIDQSLVLAITQKNKSDRTYYVLSSTARETVEWYYCIASAKYGNNSDSAHTETNTISTHMYKTGPNSHDKWKRRWFSLSNNYITYFKEKLDSHAKGHIEIGNTSEGYNLIEGPAKHGKETPTEYSFTLITPNREFKLCAETKEDQQAWMKALRQIVLIE